MGMLNQWNVLNPFRLVCQRSAHDICALRDGLDLAPTHLDALRTHTASGRTR
ncbi:MAG: hypothetical protein HYU66_10265 [Armatimonadetes bacterium]|nr:hypothetical protein [Armatimonadota bacterium]